MKQCFLTLALVGTLAPLAQADTSLQPPAASIKTAVPLKAEPFALRDVQLLDSPFKKAMERDRDYLLSLDPDRLLHTFRLNAGLPSTAQPLGGWESPKVELRGHFIGHYLSGCALMYASTGDERLKERAALMVRELAKCQAALGTSGYLSAFPESFIDRVETTGKVWAPYYTLHKVHAGLLDVHALCGNAEALEAAKKFGDWVVARNARLTDEQLQKMLDVEHGGINESMANLYALTGEQKYLDGAKRLYHKKVLDPLMRREDKLAGLHANTQFPKVIGLARLYELTGQEKDRASAEFFWDRVVNHHSYVIGGNSDHEHFGPPDKLAQRVSPWTAETCNTHNMMKLTRHLFAWAPTAAQFDYYERALYNQILASQDSRNGAMAYHIPLYGGWFMPYNTPHDSFWCCTGTGVENHAKYSDSIYWHDAGGLWVNLFIASELNWREKGLTLRQETRYPEEDITRLTIQCAQPVQMALRLRYPSWAQSGMSVKLNGEAFAYDAKPGSYVTIDRAWKSGDRVEVQLPMSLRLVPMPDDANRAAICYGPVVLAGALGDEGIKPPMPYAKSQGDFFKTGKAPGQPVLVASGRAVSEWLERVPDAPLTFRTRGVGRPNDVSLTAFYRLPPQRYTLYWDLMTEEQYQKQQATAEKRDKELALRTVDSVSIGDAESEKSRAIKGDRTEAGTFNGRPWRHATDGGWFSYELAALTDARLDLLCTYWGSDAGPREFDILVEGQKIATQKLNRDKPEEFFDVVYAIPPELSKGKTRITVRFQALPGRTAGGVFECRVMRKP